MLVVIKKFLHMIQSTVALDRHSTVRQSNSSRVHICELRRSKAVIWAGEVAEKSEVWSFLFAYHIFESLLQADTQQGAA